MRYAQERPGQRLHMVEDYGNGAVSNRALCGRTAHWRATFNLPLNYACRACTRVYDARYSEDQRRRADVAALFGGDARILERLDERQAT